MKIIPHRQVLLDSKFAEEIRDVPIYEVDADTVKSSGRIITIVLWSQVIEN